MWNSIIGQERVIGILKQIYSGGKVPHSYIFSGKEGTGKDAVAIEFAKLLNCDNKTETDEACGFCKSCKHIGSLEADIFRFLTALPVKAFEKEKEDDKPKAKTPKIFEIIREEFAKKSSDNYYSINIPDANDIRIESIRNLIESAYLTTEKGKKKVFLISNADRMNHQSQNALLKVLEEPPPNNILILTTSRINTLLPTIIGRCQIISFDNLTEPEITGFLRNYKTDLTDTQVKLFAALSDGSISKCKEILDLDYLDNRENVISLLRAIVTGETGKIGKEIGTMLDGKSKVKLRQLLLIMSHWFRDIAYYKSGMQKGIINIDKIENIKAFCERYKSDNFRIASLIEDSQKDIDGNINQELILYRLSYSLRNLIVRAGGT